MNWKKKKITLWLSYIAFVHNYMDIFLTFSMRYNWRGTKRSRGFSRTKWIRITWWSTGSRSSWRRLDGRQSTPRRTAASYRATSRGWGRRSVICNLNCKFLEIFVTHTSFFINICVLFFLHFGTDIIFELIIYIRIVACWKYSSLGV